MEYKKTDENIYSTINKLTSYSYVLHALTVMKYIAIRYAGHKLPKSILLKYFVEVPTNNNGICIVQLLIYICLLTITH